MACAAWWPTLHLGFIWDDHFTIENNSTLQSWSWSHVAHDFKTGLFDDPRGGDFYRPLIAFVDRIDYSLYGLHPGGYHRSNLLFHILNSLLVMLLVIRLGFSRLAALTTGCLCAVHPINVQDMVMVTGRCGLLCMLFTLTTLLFLMKKDVGSLIAAGLAYSLALLAKESALAIPFFYLAIVWLQRTQTLREVMVSLRLLLVLSGIYLAVRQFVPVAFTIPLSSRHWLFFMMHAFPQILFSYAKLVLVPLLLYPNRVIAPTQAHWLLFAGLFFCFAIWCWTRSARWPFFCLLWVTSAFLPPTIVMLSKSLIHDHWAYPALLGFLLPLALLFERGMTGKKEEWRRIAKTAVVLLVVGWVGLAHWHIAQRRTDADFFRWAARFAKS